MTIPFLDPRESYLELKEEIDSAYQRVMNSGTYILGEEVRQFETDFATYCGSKHCVGVASGLDALILSLKALGIEEGDEVIVPSHTFIATWLAVTSVKAIPIPVEPDPATFNINSDQLEGAITSKTRAIIAVHLYGLPADLPAISYICKKHNLFLIEDAAQAHGARVNGTRIGSHGDAVCWSFYPGKNLGAFGDGGAITTNSDIIAERTRILGNYGSKKKYENEVCGVNSRLDPLQAAMLRVKLNHLDRWNKHRQEIADIYISSLSGTGIELPVIPVNYDHVWHLFVIRHPRRDSLQEYLAKNDIISLIHYPIPPHLQEAYRSNDLIGHRYPIAEKMAEQVISLPIGPHIGDQTAHFIASCVLNFLASNSS
ncbi:DegT/DnrJ/EryC1/StrS family aminotransferase [Thalassospira sp.]|uniref:DegT/DnrJ/EryC1/StrS family aminotransferase n=1 Tax=Thalassospira sp. TaxID=1912094 RepID=UPI001B0C2AC5|nr:DegT/DnrJ/EryC1/StrS family aminotransferase [Thalassospira sp.]MBO6807600.1 DegT/DnrJ/EryC1/StrS family aminotransferase [Thalassospira sp.]MBO6840125.1 DegT/DnrJ/EryC1/StrS family aminotransferase [Thalassospira sp.]